jgi:hypothetical protein
MKIVIDQNLSNFASICREIKGLVEAGMPDYDQQEIDYLAGHEEKVATKRTRIREDEGKLAKLVFPPPVQIANPTRQALKGDERNWDNYIPVPESDRVGLSPERLAELTVLDKIYNKRLVIINRIKSTKLSLPALDRKKIKAINAIEKKKQWYRNFTIAVPNEIVGTNLAEHLDSYFVVSTKSAIARTKTYYELGVSVKGGKVTTNKNAVNPKGNIIERSSKFWFFPFFPGDEILSELSTSWNEDSHVYILDKNLTFEGAEIRPPGEEFPPTDYFDTVPNAYPKLDANTLVVAPSVAEANRWARGYLKRNIDDDFKEDDRVMIVQKIKTEENAFLKLGQKVFYAGKDANGPRVKLTEKTKNSWSLGNESHWGAVQHVCVRSVEQCQGMPADQHFSLIGPASVVDQMAAQLAGYGLYYILKFKVGS